MERVEIRNQLWEIVTLYKGSETEKDKFFNLLDELEDEVIEMEETNKGLS